MDECIFKTVYGNNCDGNVLSVNRDRKIIDTLHKTLSPLLDENPNLKVKFHLNCANK